MSTTILLKKENISMVIDASHPGKERVLLEGHLVIKNAHAIKKALLTALNRSQNLTLVFSNILKLDLAILQLLFALQKSASRFEKTISIDMESTDYLKSVILNSGMESIPAINFKINANGIH
jgi:hypothetical protein